MSGNNSPRGPEVSVVIIGWNSLVYLPKCLRSLEEQTLRPVQVILVDNGSTDGTQEWLKKHHPAVELIQNSENVGFCQANNQGIVASRADYVLLVNTDVILKPSFIAVLVDCLESDSRLGWASGKLLSLKHGQEVAGDLHPVIDSAGEIVYRSRRAVNRGVEEVDCGQYDRREEVFGVTAAAAIYRRAMLEDIRLGDDYFDRDYFAYLEDCDLNWRAQLRGWRCLYAPEAVGFHVRQHPGGRNVAIRRRAYFNRYLNILKNETGINLLLGAPHILTYDIYRTLRAIWYEPDVLLGIFAAIGLAWRSLEKRRIIQRRRKVSSRSIRAWMVPENYLRQFVVHCLRIKLPRASTLARKAP